MADYKSFSRYNMRCGLIVRAEEGERKLEGFDLPELDSRFLVITAQDIPSKNEINILGTTIPLLASDYIAYKGQPLLVLFGPDYESVALALDKIVVKTAPLESERSEDTSLPNPLFFSWGLDETPEDSSTYENMEKVESSYEIKQGEIPITSRYTVLSWKDNSGIIHVECPTQWPEMVKESISSALHKAPDSITLHSSKYVSKYDEYLIAPAFHATFTALATEITGLACEMREQGMAERTGISVQATTWLDSNNKPKHEEISVTVDQGAWAVGRKEIQRQIMVGILPKYPLDSFKAVIRTQQTPNRPATFSGHMVYASAITARSLHAVKLAKKMNINPSLLSSTLNKDSTKFTDWAPKHELGDLNEKIKRVCDVSDFNRKWSSIALHAGKFGIQGYLDGIGISSGLSIAGFSTSMAKQYQFIAQISYTAKRNIAIYGTIPSSISSDRTIKDTLSHVFSPDGKEETVLFLEPNHKTPDSGPDILSSYSSDFLSQLMKATSKLSQLVKNNNEEETPLPLSVKFNAQNQSLPCEYEYTGFGASVAEVRIPKTSLSPEVKKLWLNVAYALPFNRGAKEKIKRLAIQTISSLGLKTASDFTVNIETSSEKAEVISYSSLENMVESLVNAAITTALWQAVGYPANMTMPLTAEEVEIITGGEKQ